MRLGVSAEFVRPGRVGGAEQALHALVRGLDAVMRPNDSLRVVGDVPIVGGVHTEPPRFGLSSRFLQEAVTLRHLSQSVDLFYLPNYFTPPVPRHCHVVTTIHDAQYRTFSSNFSRRKRAWLGAAHGWTLRTASAVTTVSEWARGELLDVYGQSHIDRISVVPNAIDWLEFGSHRVDSPRPYVLAVAGHYAHKNLETLVRSFRRVYDVVGGVDLVLVGQLAENLVGVCRSSSVREVVLSEGLRDDVIVTGYVSATELGALYRGAQLFVFPSLYEGFGLPPVEALGFGLPVITTRCASIPEVTLGLAEYVDDPEDEDELAQRIIAQLESPTPPAPEDVARIRSTYDPDVVAARMLELFESVVA